MLTDLTSRDEAPSNHAHWFGVTGSIFAWFALGFADIVITWRTCLNPEQFGGTGPHPLARVLYFASTLTLFAIAVIAGAACYQNWRRLTGLPKLLQAEGRERNEFLVLAGMFISLTLGAGIVWLCIPLFIVQMCIRAR
jgi:hypothetical protein